MLMEKESTQPIITGYCLGWPFSTACHFDSPKKLKKKCQHDVEMVPFKPYLKTQSHGQQLLIA